MAYVVIVLPSFIVTSHVICNSPFTVNRFTFSVTAFSYESEIPFGQYLQSPFVNACASLTRGLFVPARRPNGMAVCFPLKYDLSAIRLIVAASRCDKLTYRHPLLYRATHNHSVWPEKRDINSQEQYTHPYHDDRLAKVVVEPNYRSHGTVMNLAKSWGIVEKCKMNGIQYRKIK